MTESPRWRLMVDHYLNVPGTEWEHVETAENKKRPVRKRYPVPMLLEIKDAGCWTEGQIIVVTNDLESTHPTDVIFLGDPTAEMTPMNAAAQAISDSMRHKWTAPMGSDAFPGQFGQSMLAGLEAQFAELVQKAGGVPKELPANQAIVDKTEFETLKQQLATLMAQNAELLAAMQQAPETPRRA